MTNLSLYECDDLINALETQAELHDGELAEEDIKALVEAHTQSMDLLNKLIRLVKYLEGFDVLAKTEIDRIQTKRKTANKSIEYIKRYLLPYVQTHGPRDVGVYRLSTRKSQGVVLADGFNNPQYGRTVTEFKPDKKRIKDSIKNGIEVKGAMLEDRINVQIK
jgi:hypothetical protein